MGDLTALGQLLEEARGRAGISKREAARRAGISEGRWRQVVTGVQSAAGMIVPVNPRPITVVAMARAVAVDERAALRAAGLDDQIVPASATAPPDWPSSGDPLIDEINASRILNEELKQLMIRGIRQADAAAQAERQAARDMLRRQRDEGAA